MTAEKIDPILLEVLWNRLISIVNEQAAALMHASFTTVVREAGDLSAGVFDAAGNMLAQAVTGTPGHINTMANCVRDHVVKAFPIDTLQPGDSLIINNPWQNSGHLFDLTIITPVFYQGKGIGWFANCCHAMDIGGQTMGADARDVFEEGLHIPLMKLFIAGEANETLFQIIKGNVRVPQEVVGDIYAQQAGNDVGATKLVQMMEAYQLDDLSELSTLILDRTEKALREAIGQVPNGTYRDEVWIDGFDDPIKICVAITVKGQEIIVDYEGTSPQVDRGINVVYNYTHAYTTYPLKCAIGPNIPNNEGSFRPITVKAPEGSIVNCRFPAAVGARHLIGHFVSQPIFGALAKAIPDRVIADSSAGLWNTQLSGELDSGKIFAYIYFSAGGMGARPDQDGLSATAYPSGITGVPAEVIESVAPVLMHKRELRIDSGGAGQFRGGLGQEMVLETRTGQPVVHSCMYDRTRFPARGFLGASSGSAGEILLSDGTRPHPKSKYVLQPKQTVTLRLPGGGGFNAPWKRDPTHVLNDVRQGFVSLQAAEDIYGVIIQAEDWVIDHEATAKKRDELRGSVDD
ncbi:MAG: hydantoinase B/oxoprolinase family protein [Chloroflexota bacterium]